MKLITHEQIKNLNIKPQEAYEWIKTSFINKPSAVLPTKISLHYDEHNYFNTMPSMLPKEGVAGVKIIQRHMDATPILQSCLLLFDIKTGNPLALMDSLYLTALRTGAVAALTCETFAVKNYNTIGLWGLGNTCYATFDVLMSKRESENKNPLKVYLLKYKDHAEKFVERFKKYKSAEFIITESLDEIIKNSQVLISCVSAKSGVFSDSANYPEGVTIIPVHLNGFQNCDTVFDRVYCDDTNHVRGFKYFEDFSKRNFAEIGEVLRGEKLGRQSDKERIISYSVGLSIHDIYFAKKIYDKLKDKSDDINLKSPESKLYF